MQPSASSCKRLCRQRSTELLRGQRDQNSQEGRVLTLSAAMVISAPAIATTPAACPKQPTRVVRSVGGVIEYHGHVPGIAELCYVDRTEGDGDFYFGIWKSDWPGAGEAFPALMTVIHGPKGAKVSFVTRAAPGLQWVDSFTNEGLEAMVVAGHSYVTLRLAHEREGFDGNTYHSIITSWRDVASGITLKVHENQISGQSYGPTATWQAVSVERLLVDVRR
jgi:hypothetical protein